MKIHWEQKHGSRMPESLVKMLEEMDSDAAREIIDLEAAGRLIAVTDLWTVREGLIEELRKRRLER
jgi:hypothetical protein